MSQLRSRAGYMLYKPVPSSGQTVDSADRKHSTSGNNRANHAPLGRYTSARMSRPNHPSPKRLDSDR